MASSLESMEEELSCPVCWQLFVDKHTPIVLDCRHDVCKVCVKHLVNFKTVTCPQCRAPTNVQKRGGVSALKPNYRVRNLAEIYARSNGKDGERCVVHNDQKALFACVSCNVLVCQFCIVHEHQSSPHNCKERKDVIEERQQQCAVFLEQLREEIERCNRFARLWEERRGKVAESFENERTNVSTHIQSIVGCVEQRTTELAHKINERECERLEVITSKMETCHQKVILLSQGNEEQSCDSEDVLQNMQPEMPDSRQPFTVSMVELGTHPHSIDVESITEDSFANHLLKSDHSNEAVAIACVNIPDTHSDAHQRAKRCQEAVDSWVDLSDKVMASLGEELSKIFNHSQVIIEEITRQGNLIWQRLTDEENKRVTDIEAECDCCSQRVKRLQTLCDDISDLSDKEYITKYTSLTNDTQEAIADHITSPESDTDDSPKTGLQNRNATQQHLYLGNVFIGKCVYLRKQLITQFHCDIDIIGIDSSTESNLVVAGCS